MLLPFFVSPAGHIYSFSRPRRSAFVTVYRAAWMADDTRSEVVIRAGIPHAQFEREIADWDSHGYVRCGELCLDGTPKQIARKLQGFLAHMDAVWQTGAPVSTQLAPMFANTLTNAVVFLKGEHIALLNAAPARPSRFDWEMCAA